MFKGEAIKVISKYTPNNTMDDAHPLSSTACTDHRIQEAYNMKLLIAMIVTLTIPIFAYADDYDCEAACKPKDIQGVSISGIRLFYSKFEDVFKKFGPAKVYRPMENREAYICYTSTNNNDQTAVVFGSYNTIDTAEVYKYKSQVHPKIKCSASDKLNENIQFDSGIKLGMPINEFYKINNSTIYNSFYEISTYDCCSVAAKECKGIIRTYFTTKSMEDKIYYIKASHTEYCE